MMIVVMLTMTIGTNTAYAAEVQKEAEQTLSENDSVDSQSDALSENDMESDNAVVSENVVLSDGNVINENTTVETVSVHDLPYTYEINSCSVTIKATNIWNGGYQGEITVTNKGEDDITSFELLIESADTFENVWNGSMTRNGNQIQITPMDYNRKICAGSSVTFGFQTSGLNVSVTSVG